MGTKNNTTIANMMRDLSLSNSAPKGAYFILVALFLVSQFFVTQASRNHIDITIFGVPAQMSDFTGVFASISNALTFFLTVFYRKTAGRPRFDSHAYYSAAQSPTGGGDD